MSSQRDRFNPAVRRVRLRSQPCELAGGDYVQVTLDPVEPIVDTVETQPDLSTKLRDFAFDMGKRALDCPQSHPVLAQFRAHLVHIRTDRPQVLQHQIIAYRVALHVRTVPRSRTAREAILGGPG